jgi:hypothetical protein
VISASISENTCPLDLSQRSPAGLASAWAETTNRIRFPERSDTDRQAAGAMGEVAVTLMMRTDDQ